MSRLEGQVAIVTGAAGGLGREFVEALRAEGAEVVGCDLEERIGDLGEGGIAADVSRAKDVRRVVDTTARRHARIDILVNNAGIVRPTRAGDEWQQGIEDYDAVMGVNLRGAFLFGRAVAPIMQAQGSGHIVNISTDHVYPTPSEPVWGHGGLDLYNASKWALNGLTLDWATTLRKRGIRVNGLCMGATDTPMLRSFAGEVPDDVVATWMQPAEVAEILVALLAEGPDGRSGHNLGLWIDRPRSLDDSAPVGSRRR
jgi:NAD(P)-dependent dehydrogenase (short-subunit alcohol dehydrogenase family)